jgi:hypothetical protein
MDEHAILHPLSRWRFYWECLRYATGGAWGRSGDVSLIASLALPSWKGFFPSSYAIFESYLSVHHLSADILLWKLPLWAGGSILVLRLIAAPFFLYSNKRSASDGVSLQRTETENEAPDILLELAATRPVGADLYAAVSISICNAVDVGAMNVQIDSIESGVWEAGFNFGDPETPPGPILTSTTLVFELVPYIQGKAKVSAFPVVEYRGIAGRMLREGGTVLGLWWLLERVVEHNKYTALSALPSDASPLNRDITAAAAEREPFDVPIRVTYWNRKVTRQWERVETLRYNPVSRRAHIRRHGPPAEIAVTRQIVTADPPDVTLAGTFPGKFSLHARGHACEIRTGPIVLASSIVGTVKDGDVTRNERMPRYTLEFPVVSDLHDGETEVVPALFCGEGYSRGAWPEKESNRTGMAEFLRMAEYLRRVEIGEPDTKTSTDAQITDFAERIRRPLTIGFDITFWNSDHSIQWKRSELLVYEPLNGAAFVRHAGTPERLVASAERRL